MITHVYEREFDPAAEDSLAIIARQIPEACTVLDVGTGSGALGRYLSSARGCIVDGTTLSDEELSLAEAGYRDVKIVDLDRQALSAVFDGRTYDVIVFADVLEHLLRSEEVLADARRLLAPQGCVFVSVPNVLYAGVLYSMLMGSFARTHEGLLDSTHLKFFDHTSLQAMVSAGGFEIIREEAVALPIGKSEFRQLPLDVIPVEVRRYVESRPLSSIYQYVLTIKQAAVGQAMAVRQYPAVVTPTLRPEFMAQVFVNRGYGFSEDDAQRRYVYGDEDRVTIVFEFSGPVSELRSLRVDFCDRRGVFWWNALKVLGAGGEVLWDWAGRAELVSERNQVELYPDGGRPGFRVWAEGDDPWVHVHVSDLTGHDDVKWVVELDMTPPQVYDAMMALRPKAEVDALRVIQSEIERLHPRLSAQGDDVRQVKEAWLHVQNELRCIWTQVSDMNERNAEQRAQATESLRVLERTCHELELKLQDKEKQLASIYASFTWQAGMPFRYVARQIRKWIGSPS